MEVAVEHWALVNPLDINTFHISLFILFRES
jgi:hypothetical protein